MSAFETIAKALNGGSLLSHEDAESFEIGGVLIKVMVLKKGDQIVTHSHAYTHAHVLGKGKILLEVDGMQAIFHAPAVIEIVAGKHHGMTALEDSNGFCIHELSQLEDGQMVGEPFKGM